MKRLVSSMLVIVFAFLLSACDFTSKEEKFNEFINRLDTAVREYEANELYGQPYSLEIDVDDVEKRCTVMLRTYSDSGLSGWIQSQLSGSSLSSIKIMAAEAILRNSIIKKDAGCLILGRLRLDIANLLEEYSSYDFLISYVFSTADGDVYQITDQDMEQALYNDAAS